MEYSILRLIFKHTKNGNITRITSLCKWHNLMRFNYMFYSQVIRIKYSDMWIFKNKNYKMIITDIYDKKQLDEIEKNDNVIGVVLGKVHFGTRIDKNKLKKYKYIDVGPYFSRKLSKLDEFVNLKELVLGNAFCNNLNKFPNSLRKLTYDTTHDIITKMPEKIKQINIWKGIFFEIMNEKTPNDIRRMQVVLPTNNFYGLHYDKLEYLYLFTLDIKYIISLPKRLKLLILNSGIYKGLEIEIPKTLKNVFINKPGPLYGLMGSNFYETTFYDNLVKNNVNVYEYDCDNMNLDTVGELMRIRSNKIKKIN